jgi:hypothetical protein
VSVSVLILTVVETIYQSPFCMRTSARSAPMSGLVSLAAATPNGAQH